MSHPFDLELSDLAAIELYFAEELTDEEAATVRGGITAATPEIGEQGERIKQSPWKPKYPRQPKGKGKPKDEDPIFTTLALGEEGGSPHLPYV